MNRPWYMNPGLWLTGIFWAGIGLFWTVVSALGRRRQRRRTAKELDAAQKAFAAVSLDLEATELNARTVPEDSRYGGMLLERYRGFHDRYVELAAENDRLSGLSPRQLHRKEHRRAVEAFREQATELDRLDDSVAAANTFLNRQHGWQDAWDLQAAPLREDLRRLETLGGLQEADRAALLSFRTEAEAELDRVGAELVAEQIGPDDALDRIGVQRARLTELLERAAEDSVQGFASGASERSTLEDEFRRTRARSSRSRSGSILDSVHEPGHYWTVGAYSAGRQSGRQKVRRARSAKSSSSTGYGRSGGSFSGSGSSSRF